MPTQWTSPGARRRKVILQQEIAAGTGAKTALGFLAGGTANWTTVQTVWACITPKQVMSLPAVGASDQPRVWTQYLINIRYIPGVAILPGMRVVEQDPAVTVNGATYVITSVVDVDERHRELTLYCWQAPATASPNQ